MVLTPEHGGISFNETARWSEGESGHVARFVFTDVPVGDYVLRIVPSGVQYPWEPYEMDVRCPASDLTFVCRDDLKPVPVRISIHDASTQLELPRMWAFVEISAGISTPRQSSYDSPNGVTVGYLVPGRTTLEWVVCAPGYKPRRGDGNDLAEGRGVAGPVLEADVFLDPGWGMLLEVLESQRTTERVPIPGASVYVDGEYEGKTNANGRILLTEAERPANIEVKHPSLNLRYAEPFDLDGKVTAQFMVRGRVWMR